MTNPKPNYRLAVNTLNILFYCQIKFNLFGFDNGEKIKLKKKFFS